MARISRACEADPSAARPAGAAWAAVGRRRHFFLVWFGAHAGARAFWAERWCGRRGAGARQNQPRGRFDTTPNALTLIAHDALTLIAQYPRARARRSRATRSASGATRDQTDPRCCSTCSSRLGGAAAAGRTMVRSTAAPSRLLNLVGGDDGARAFGDER